MTSLESFWVTDLGEVTTEIRKVVSIKCLYEQKSIAHLFILYDEKHCQNRSRFGTRTL